MRLLLAIGVLLVVAFVIAGCGAGVDSVQPQHHDNPGISGGALNAVATETVTSGELDYQGWKALRMQNGLVEIVCVPAIGGRIMSYALGGHNMLWNNPAEYGKTYPAAKSEDDRKWHNFGGYKVWPAPQSDWHGPPDPVGSPLEGAAWEGKITTASGPYAEITLTSPADKTVTGLQMTRRIRLYAGTTKLTVREAFKNVSAKPVRWSIWEVTQLPGKLDNKDKDTVFSPEAQAFIPLNPASKFADGYTHLVKTDKDTEQFTKIANNTVVQTSYKHLTDKIGVDSVAGWAAAVDGVNGYAMVKRFEVRADKDHEYPDGGSTVENWTNPDEAYMELEVLSPLYDIQPGQEQTFEEQWYLAKMSGPIVGATDAAAIRVPVTMTIADGEATLSGEIGSFAPGKLKIAFMDGNNHSVGDVVTMDVSPMTDLKLDRKMKVPAGAVKLALKVNDTKDKLVGMVAELPVTTATAAAPPAGTQAAAPAAYTQAAAPAQ